MINNRPFGKSTCDCGCLNKVIKTEIRNGRLYWVDYIEGHENNKKVKKKKGGWKVKKVITKPINKDKKKKKKVNKLHKKRSPVSAYDIIKKKKL